MSFPVPGGFGGAAIGLKVGGFLLNVIRPSIPLDIQNGHRVEPRGYMVTKGDPIEVVGLTELGPGTKATLSIFKTALGLTSSYIGAGRIGTRMRSVRGAQGIIPNLSNIHVTMDTIVDANGTARWDITPDIYGNNDVVGVAMLDPVRSNFVLIFMRPSSAVGKPSTQLYTDEPGVSVRTLTGPATLNSRGIEIPGTMPPAGPGFRHRLSFQDRNPGVSPFSLAGKTTQSSRGAIIPGTSMQSYDASAPSVEAGASLLPAEPGTKYPLVGGLLVSRVRHGGILAQKF